MTVSICEARVGEGVWGTGARCGNAWIANNPVQADDANVLPSKGRVVAIDGGEILYGVVSP